jgi:hypothetical protein
VEVAAEITVVASFDACEANPPYSRFDWYEDWHCVEFRLRTKGGLASDLVEGTIDYYLGALLIGQVPVKMLCVDSQGEISEAELVRHSSADPYQVVFVSYSHADADIVDDLEMAYQALGLKYCRDLYSLRSGEQWSPALLKLIEQADIFQLCWSTSAQTSKWVEHEWRHALSLDRSHFIRPVYWEIPLPAPPTELAGIHFAFLPWRSRSRRP